MKSEKERDREVFSVFSLHFLQNYLKYKKAFSRVFYTQKNFKSSSHPKIVILGLMSNDSIHQLSMLGRE